MILCLGSIADETFWAGVSALAQHGVPTHVIDIVELSIAGSVTGNLNHPPELTIKLDGTSCRLGDFAGIWARLTGLSEGAPDAALRRRAATLEGALGLACRRASTVMPVINPPAIDRSNFAKTLHVALHGRDRPWLIPRSCLTNDPAAALAFVASCEYGVVYKGGSGVKTWAAAYDPAADAARMSLVSTCPVLFQERICGPDIRVHVVGREAFTEQIICDGIDYRTMRGNVYSKTEVSPAIRDACVSLTRDMGLTMSGIDFKRDERTGQLYFLEANSMPCFEGYDRRAGGAISDALVRTLSSGVAE